MRPVNVFNTARLFKGSEYDRIYDTKVGSEYDKQYHPIAYSSSVQNHDEKLPKSINISNQYA